MLYVACTTCYNRRGNYAYGCSFPLPGAWGGRQINGTASGCCGHDSFTSPEQARASHHRQPGYSQATSGPSTCISGLVKGLYWRSLPGTYYKKGTSPFTGIAATRNNGRKTEQYGPATTGAVI